MKLLKVGLVSFSSFFLLFSGKNNEMKNRTMVTPTSIEVFKQIKAGLKEVCNDSLYIVRVLVSKVRIGIIYNESEMNCFVS
jgi:hypothetical protein